MNTFESIIQFAMRHEDAEARFYRAMADKAESPDLQQQLLERAHQEEEHKQRLEEILTNHQLPGGARRYPDPNLHIADYAVAEAIESETVNYQDALIRASKREDVAHRLYTDLAERTEDADLKRLFTYLAEQEAAHRNALEQEYDKNILKED